MPFFEHARNDSFTSFGEKSFGGNTRRPAAWAGWHLLGEKTPTSLICSWVQTPRLRLRSGC